MKRLVVASKNKGKIKEFEQMLGKFDFQVLSLNDFGQIEEPEETGSTFLDNAKLKASYYAQKTKEYCMADDSGLQVDALNGAPGVYSARYAGLDATDEKNNKLLIKNMTGQTNRNCQFFCALAIADPTGKIVFTTQGLCHGTLLEQPIGDNGFGYDPLFFSVDLQKTLAQALPDEKNSISHRSKALQDMVKLLDNR